MQRMCSSANFQPFPKDSSFFLQYRRASKLQQRAIGVLFCFHTVRRSQALGWRMDGCASEWIAGDIIETVGKVPRKTILCLIARTNLLMSQT